MTQTHFYVPILPAVSPKTTGHSIFGPPCDIIGGVISTDPWQVYQLCSHIKKTVILFLNGILLYVLHNYNWRRFVLVILKGSFSLGC